MENVSLEKDSFNKFDKILKVVQNYQIFVILLTIKRQLCKVKV